MQRTIKGISEGWYLETLPEHKKIFHEQIYTRIFRISGGICFLLIMTRNVFLFPDLIAYLIVFIFMMHMVYICYICISRLIHIRWLYINGKLVVRNSPLDPYSTLFKFALTCVKGGCVAIGTASATFGLMAGYETILELGGHAPVFLPRLAE